MTDCVHIFEDLLNTYSSYLRVPLSLVNISGEIIVSVNGSSLDPVGFNHESTSLLEEIKTMIENIKRPVSIIAGEEAVALNYILSPLIKDINSQSFLLAGPFAEVEFPTTDIAPSVACITPDRKNNLLESIGKLHAILTVIYKEKQSHIIKKDTFEFMNDFSFLDENCEFFSSIFQKLSNMYELDFVGIASKKTTDSFRIDFITGQEVQPLIGSSFYIGEGLLGQSVAAEKEMVWDKRQSKRAELFNKIGIQPHHLFSYPVKKYGVVEALIFGGKLKDIPFDQELHNMMNCMVKFMAERLRITEAVGMSNVINEYYDCLVDVMDVFIHSTNPKNLLYKVMEVCRTLNKGLFVCSTIKGGEFFLRGTANDKLRVEHERLSHCIGKPSSHF